MSQQPPPYPSSPPASPFPPVPPDHPQATTILVLGIIGHLLCGLTSPFAWVMGAKARREIKASNGAIGGSTQVTIGWAMGIVGCVQLLLVLAYFGVIIVLGTTGALNS